MNVIYFEVTKADLADLGDWVTEQLKKFCERKYEIDDLQIIFSFEIGNKVRYACVDASAPSDEKVSEVFHLKRVYESFPIVSSLF